VRRWQKRLLKQAVIAAAAAVVAAAVAAAATAKAKLNSIKSVVHQHVYRIGHMYKCA
jgi:Spy/CpxP family protein refolding chaperone